MRREVNAEVTGDAILRLRIVEAGAALLMSDAMPQGQVVPNLRLVLPGSLQEPVAPLVQYGTCGAVANYQKGDISRRTLIQARGVVPKTLIRLH
jgi:hypothetical protein